MIRGTIFFLFEFAALSLLAPRLARADLEISYSTPVESIEIREGKLLLERREHTYPERSPSPNPTGMILRRWEVKIPKEELDALRRKLRSSGFFKLRDRYGSPVRRYLHKLRVKDDGREKSVEHASGPDDGGGPPPAMQKLTSHLTELAERLTKDVPPVQGR